MTDTPWTLEGREWEGDAESDSSLCIFCGRQVWHINDPEGRGEAWAGGIKGQDGQTRMFLYCNRPFCNNEHVWTCKDCQVDNIGPTCHGCDGRRQDMDRALFDEEEPPAVERTVLALLVTCEYDPARFTPVVEDPGPGRCNLVDVAHFADKLEDCRDPDPPYRLSDVTVYTLQGLLLDMAEGKLRTQQQDEEDN